MANPLSRRYSVPGAAPAAAALWTSMLFNSGEFLVFFAAVYLAYRCLPHRRQNQLLLAASYLFYGYWDSRFLALIAASTLVDYAAALGIERSRQERSGRERAWLGASVATNLGLLGFFKYFDFFAEGFAALLEGIGLRATPMTLNVVLPVGISFYTFQTLSYTIDVYRGRERARCRFLDVALYVAFFPQLLAGPIERARTLLPQLERPRVISSEQLQTGAWLIFWGLFKKVYVADNLAPYTYWGAVRGEASGGLEAYLVAVAFAIQFYADFSGYSDMARGLARLLGIELHVNFRFPYFSPDPATFWRRWHATLSSWVRDYIYVPLRRRWRIPAGSSLALLATMTLMGLWHGASWTFVLWGFAWGVVLVAYRAWRPWSRRLLLRHPPLRPAWKLGGTLLTLQLWIVLGALFVAPRISDAADLFAKLVGGGGVSPHLASDAFTVAYYTWPLAVLETAQYRVDDPLVHRRWPLLARIGLYTGLATLLLVIGAEGEQAFIYFQF